MTELQVLRDLRYGEHPLHTWDLYIPSGISESPDSKAKGVIVFVHGGAWRSGDKSEHETLARNLLSASKLPIAVPNYRLSPRTPPPDSEASIKHPVHVQDTSLALDAIISSQNLRQISDTSRVFLIGHSCGAHMLASLLLDPPAGEGAPSDLRPSVAVNDAIKGVVLAEGIHDLDLLLETFPSYQDFVQGAFPGSNFSPFSVTRYSVREGAPLRWLVVQSHGDTLIDEAQAASMYAHLQSEYGRMGWDTALVQKDFDSTTEDHDKVLLTTRFAEVACRILEEN